MTLDDLMGTEPLSEHESAWKMQDWDKVAELAKEYGSNPSNDRNNIMEQLNYGKTRLNVSLMDYSPMWIDLAMSQHVDTVISAYVMNLIGSKLNPQMHFDYYLHSVRAGKRYGSWAKYSDPDPEKLVCIKMLQKIYAIGEVYANEYYDELVDLNQLDSWKKKNKMLAVSIVHDVVKTKTEQKSLEKTILKW